MRRGARAALDLGDEMVAGIANTAILANPTSFDGETGERYKGTNFKASSCTESRWKHAENANLLPAL